MEVPHEVAVFYGVAPVRVRGADVTPGGVPRDIRYLDKISRIKLKPQETRAKLETMKEYCLLFLADQRKIT